MGSSDSEDSAGRGDHLRVPLSRTRGVSLPDGMEESLARNKSYLLRQFNIKGRKVIHLGDSFQSRAGSLASLNSHSSHGLPAHQTQTIQQYHLIAGVSASIHLSHTRFRAAPASVWGQALRRRAGWRKLEPPTLSWWSAAVESARRSSWRNFSAPLPTTLLPRELMVGLNSTENLIHFV